MVVALCSNVTHARCQHVPWEETVSCHRLKTNQSRWAGHHFRPVWGIARDARQAPVWWFAWFVAIMFIIASRMRACQNREIWEYTPHQKFWEICLQVGAIPFCCFCFAFVSLRFVVRYFVAEHQNPNGTAFSNLRSRSNTGHFGSEKIWKEKTFMTIGSMICVFFGPLLIIGPYRAA